MDSKCTEISSWRLFLLTVISWTSIGITAWKYIYIHVKQLDAITDPFINFGANSDNSDLTLDYGMNK